MGVTFPAMTHRHGTTGVTHVARHHLSPMSREETDHRATPDSPRSVRQRESDRSPPNAGMRTANRRDARPASVLGKQPRLTVLVDAS